jgi:hypothetical protein
MYLILSNAHYTREAPDPLHDLHLQVGQKVPKRVRVDIIMMDYTDQPPLFSNALQ